MFIAGLGGTSGAIWVMLLGRVVMGLGVGMFKSENQSMTVTMRPEMILSFLVVKTKSIC